MMTRFYHTERRGYIVADVVDLGAKGVTVAVTGYEALAPERLPKTPGARPIKQSPSMARLLDAAQTPGTLTELAERAGVSEALAKHARSGGKLQVVDTVKIDGRWQKIWGAA